MAKTLYYFRPTALGNVLRRLPRTYKLIPIDRDAKEGPAWQLPAVLIADAAKDDVRQLGRLSPPNGQWRVISLLKGDAPPRSHSKVDAHIFATLPHDVSRFILQNAIEKAFENVRSETEHELTRQELHLAAAELETVNKIGVALSSERNTDALLELILTKSREITGCDAGSLYVVDEEVEGEGKHLVFKLTQSDSHSVPFRRFTLPIDTKSIAGYAAATGEILNIKDAYRITKLPLHHNREFDEKFGYRTKSMLVVPMKNQKDEVIGVLQLINAKKDPTVKLISPKKVHEEVIPFSQRSQDLASSLASQAGVALENAQLYRQIEDMFEGFVKASVKAIELRDPTTLGHSERVATYTVRLAEAVDRSESGPFKDIKFSRQEIKEFKYASLLHDFGKVGVRENVLVKEKKLYPSQLKLIEKRFLYTKKAVELESLRKKVDYLIRNGNQNYQETLGVMDADYQKEAQRLEEFLESILQANKPTVLPEETSEKLLEVAGWPFDDPSGQAEPLLSPEELRFLSIRKGSLDDAERAEIESHVIHSFNFLCKIPWTKEFRDIPNIARAHHEKLNGTGYPYHMKAEEIPFPSKMMTISDIYDALTAKDRPYKKAVPIERALDIIGQEVKSQLLDPVLFDLFVEAKIFQLTAKD